MRNWKIKVKKSSVIGVFIIYYLLMDSSFPFGNNSKLLGFFYWSKYGVALLVISYAAFFIKNRMVDGQLRSVCRYIRPMLLAPWFVMILYSCVIWLLQRAAMPYVTRGISNFISCILPIMMGLALAKIYGTRIIRLAIVAVWLMAITNYIVGLAVNGPTFIIQLFNINCIESTYRIYKELHEIAYIFGLFLIFFLFKKDYRLNRRWIFFISLGFFFAWKRIGILALVMSFVFYWILKRLNRNSKEISIAGCGFVAVVLCMIYVYICTSGGLTFVLSQYGINMMGRDVLYSYFTKFCDFSLGFIGRGVGFVSRQFNYLTYADVGAMAALQQGLHNDLFSIFIEIGLIGYVAWLIHNLIYIPKKIGNYFGLKSAMQCFTYIIFTFVTYTTDNTFRYFVFQMILTVLMVITSYDNLLKGNNTQSTD